MNNGHEHHLRCQVHNINTAQHKRPGRGELVHLHKGMLQRASQVRVQGGAAVVTNNVNICYQNLINQPSAVVEQRPGSGMARDDRARQMSSFFYFTICLITQS